MVIIFERKAFDKKLVMQVQNRPWLLQIHLDAEIWEYGEH